jgi:lipopolysaccharide export system permease protein
MAYLVQASTGDIPATSIFQLLALKLLSDIMLILPLGFFLALLLALGRLYKDNEITAMAACGIGVPVTSIISLGVMFALLIGILSLLLAPWAERKMIQLQTQLKAVAEVGGIAAGRFKEFNHGNGIFYVETIDTDSNSMHTLFMQVNLPNKRVIMVAKRGYQTAIAGELFLVLVDGRRYESKPGSLSYVVTEFAEHHIRIPKRLDTSERKPREAIPTSLLWFAQEARLQAELQWRLSLPLSVIFLAALAVPLSYTTPRQGQYAKILVGILIYLIYNNLLNVARKWVERGDVSPIIGVWWVHVGLLLIIVALFYLPLLKNGFRRLFKPFYLNNVSGESFCAQKLLPKTDFSNNGFERTDGRN